MSETTETRKVQYISLDSIRAKIEKIFKDGTRIVVHPYRLMGNYRQNFESEESMYWFFIKQPSDPGIYDGLVDLLDSLFSEDGEKVTYGEYPWIVDVDEELKVEPFLVTVQHRSTEQVMDIADELAEIIKF